VLALTVFKRGNHERSSTGNMNALVSNEHAAESPVLTETGLSVILSNCLLVSAY
jgi:hypothetical protein